LWIHSFAHGGANYELAGQVADKPAHHAEPPWATLHGDALHGLAGEVVATIEPHTEADPVALLLQLLTYFGNSLNRGPYYQVESDRHFTNLYTVLVGETSKGRKGVAANRIRQVVQSFAPSWVKKCIQSGLSSGEGVIQAIRDPITKENDKGKEVVVDKGVKDKRLLLDEREFFGALAVMQRQGNIVSRVVRDAWDGRDLQTLTKNSPLYASEPMVSIVGGITADELRRTLDQTSMANGYANRFLFACVRRARVLPFGGSLKQKEIDALGAKLKAVHLKACMRERMQMDAKARELWAAVYPELSAGAPGMLGAICGRAEAQTVRLALIYALLDGASKIGVVHLKAGLALWRYCADSARYIFGNSLGDPMADDIERALRTGGGMNRTQINDLFGRNQPAGKISAALGVLAKHGRVRCETHKGDGKGRPSELWVAI
jgi:hypothetical protein